MARLKKVEWLVVVSGNGDKLGSSRVVETKHYGSACRKASREIGIQLLPEKGGAGWKNVVSCEVVKKQDGQMNNI